MKFSPAEQAAYTQAIIEECGGDKNKISVSYVTANRSRRKVGETIATAVLRRVDNPKLCFTSLGFKTHGYFIKQE